MKPETELYIFNFAPLIQLWAGICLLFFYEKLLLENNPFETQKLRCINKIRDLHNNLRKKLVGQYQAFQINIKTGESVVPELLPEIKVDFRRDKYWGKFRRYIYITAFLSFFYSLIILVFIGIEKYEYLYNNNYHKVLVVTDTAMAFYFIAVSIWYKRDWAQKVRIHIGFLVILILYIHIHLYFRDFIHSLFPTREQYNIPRKVTTIYTLFTCVGGLICILVNIGLTKLKLWKLEKNTEHTEKKFRDISIFPLNLLKFGVIHPLFLFRIMKFIFSTHIKNFLRWLRLFIIKVSETTKKIEERAERKNVLAKGIGWMLTLIFMCAFKLTEHGEKDKNNYSDGRKNIYVILDYFIARQINKNILKLKNVYHGVINDLTENDNIGETVPS